MLDVGNQNINATKQMALTDDIKSKSDKAFGLKIAQQISSQVNGETGYYQIRNARYRLNRLFATGKIDVQSRFADRLNMDGKINFANLNWKALMIVSTIISRLVGRWMLRNQRIQATAIDLYSQEQKKDNADQAEFILDHKEMLGQLQNATGVPMIGKNDFVAEDKDDLDTWVIEGNKLPEEINYELATNNILQANGFFDTILDKQLHDAAEVGFVGVYTSMDSEGVVTPRYVQPENAIYSYSKYADFRDNKLRGEKTTSTISELRQEFGADYTEEQFYNIATTAKEWNSNDRISWTDNYINSYSRPYDDWNIDIVKFEFKTFDSETYKKKTSNNGTLIIEKNPAPNDRQGERKTRGKWAIYECVYAPTSGTVLKWKEKDNMIRSQDPKEIGQAEFSYSFYMYDQQEMHNVAVPEKIEQPVDALMLELLKIQQCIAISRPPGAAINVDAVAELDLGLSTGASSADEIGKIYDQTGKLYYRGKDAEGNPIPVPIQELANTGFLPQIQGYIQAYQFHYQTLKDQLGEDPNLMQAASTPRVGVGNVEVAQGESAAATDYMYNAVMKCYEDVAKKIACLLNDSITYGAKAYRHLLKEDDVKGRVFATEMQMMPTDAEIQRLDAQMQNAIANTQGLSVFLNPYKILQQAKINIKLANLEYNQALKKFYKSQQEETQQNQQATFQAQAQSNQQAAQAKMQQSQTDGQIELQKTQANTDSSNKNTILTMVSALLTGGVPIPPQLQPLITATIQNLMLPMVAQNEQQKQQLLQQMQTLTNQSQQQGQPQTQQPQDGIMPANSQPQQQAA